MLLQELSEKRIQISAHTGDVDLPPQLFIIQVFFVFFSLGRLLGFTNALPFLYSPSLEP